MSVRARFYVAEVSKFANGGYADPKPVGRVVMRAVARGEHNKAWASATPSGELTMTVIGGALPWFEERIGAEVSILLEDGE